MVSAARRHEHRQLFFAARSTFAAAPSFLMAYAALLGRITSVRESIGQRWQEREAADRLRHDGGGSLGVARLPQPYTVILCVVPERL